MKILLLIAAIGLLIFCILALMKKQPSTSAKYVRSETDSEKKFYKAYAPFMAETPVDVSRFIEEIQAKTGLPRKADSYPVDPASVYKAALSFAEAARSVYGFELNLEVNDASQLDRFANAHLIDPNLRAFFDGAKLKDLSEDEARQYSDFWENTEIPNEPLLYYALGSFWGTWMVSHRDFVWVLVEPLNPIQSFPDFISSHYTLCMMPFSQAVKKFSDPIGDAFNAKADYIASNKRYLGPFPLIASISDANYAFMSLLPEEAREAITKSASGDRHGAIKLYEQAISSHPDNINLYVMGQETAWALKDWKHMVEWSEALLKLKPDYPLVNYNLGVYYSLKEDGLPKAIELINRALEADPQYGLAHLTLSSCYLELGQKDKALEHARWIVEHDPELKDKAAELIKEIEKH